MNVFFGTFTNKHSKGIYRGRWNGDRISDIKLYQEIEEPSYICEKNNNIYSIYKDEIGCGYCKIEDDHIRDIFRFEEVPSCYIYTNGDRVYLANYFTGSFYDIEEKTKKKFVIKDSTCNAHYFDGRIRIELGKDRIVENGKEITFPKGSGPRHIAYHNKNSKYYVNCEYSNEVMVIENREIIQIVKSSENKESSSGAIKLSKDGEYLYVSNRGADTITVFKIDSNGYLNKEYEFSSGGNHPRDLCISPCGNYMLVANTFSDNIVVFKRDIHFGEIYKVQEVYVPEVSCILFK